MITGSRAWASGLALLLVMAACDASPAYLREEGRRKHLADLGIQRFDSAQAYRLAGVSALRILSVPAMRPGELGADTADAAFGVFSMRCGACHDRPSPGAKPAYMWAATLSRMKKNAEDAGLLPMSAEDETLILGLLQKHAADGS